MVSHSPPFQSSPTSEFTTEVIFPCISQNDLINLLTLIKDSETIAANMAPVTIHVEGQSVTYRLAERAAMSVDISEEGPSQEESLQNVTATATNCRLH